MKKKTLALIATMALVASLTACGGNTEETANNNVNEPTVESQVEQEAVVEPTEAPVVSQEATESTETIVEESPVEEAKPYTLSEVICPNGETPTDIIFEDFLNNGAYNNSAIIQPYYTLTNTSDSAYGIEIDTGVTNEYYTDSNFEAGESILVPAYLYQGDANLYGEEGLSYWLNADDGYNLLQYGYGIETSEANPAQNRIQEMMTITFDESKVLGDGKMSIELTLPENATGEGGDMQYLPSYVIYYDEAGNVISSGESCMGSYDSYNVIFYAEQTFNYPAFYYTTTNEPFIWAKADVYYSYEMAQ